MKRHRSTDLKRVTEERRFFTRKAVEVEGNLSWIGRGRFGAKKEKTSAVRTVDLSVDGAKLVVDPKSDVSRGQICEITFADRSSQAIVRDVIDRSGDTKIVCIQLHQPSSEFLQIIDQWLSPANEDHRKFQHEWLQQGG